MTDTDQQGRRQRIAVIGLGGIGGALAMALRAADRHDVVACARRPVDRLVLEYDGQEFDLDLPTVTVPDTLEPVDWVMLCTKAHHTPSAAPWLERLCGPDTRVAVLQNGIDHAARTAPFTKGAPVLPVIIYYNGERVEPDRVRLRRVSSHDLVVPAGPDAALFDAALDGTRLRVRHADDFHTRLWRKLLLNVMVNPITALTMQRQSVVRHPDIQALCLDVLAEAVAVGRADGAKLADDEAARIVAVVLDATPGLGTSMYFDRLAGRTLEVEALTGALVAAAERHGIAVPINRALLALLRAVNDAPSPHG